MNKGAAGATSPAFPIWLSFVRGLAVAAGGGGLFWLAGFPAPWLAGGLIAATVAVISGVKVVAPPGVRAIVMIVLGTHLGASITWDSIGQMARWPVSLVLLGLTMVAVVGAGTLFYSRLCGWPRLDAFFAANPGALSVTLALAEDNGADVPRIVVVQFMRLLFLVAVLPLVVTLMGAEGTGGAGVFGVAGYGDAALMIAAGAAGGLAFERLKVPSGLMLGAALVSAVLHLSGIVDGILPRVVLIPVFLVLAVYVSAQFTGFDPRQLRALAGVGTANFFAVLAVSALGAYVASLIAGVPLAVLLIAFAPGGLEVMTVMAFALGLDPAFVAVHQMARFLGLSVAVPVIAPYLARRWRGDVPGR